MPASYIARAEGRVCPCLVLFHMGEARFVAKGPWYDLDALDALDASDALHALDALGEELLEVPFFSCRHCFGCLLHHEAVYEGTIEDRAEHAALP